MTTEHSAAAWEIELAAACREAVTHPDTVRFGDRAYVQSVWERVSHLACCDTLPYTAFKAWLPRALRIGLLVLHRADLSWAHREWCNQVGRPEMLELSLVTERGVEWHLISA